MDGLILLALGCCAVGFLLGVVLCGTLCIIFGRCEEKRGELGDHDYMKSGAVYLAKCAKDVYHLTPECGYLRGKRSYRRMAVCTQCIKIKLH